jgi:hypothetical protein
MPESVNDRPASALEHVFLLTKNPHYFFDMEAIKKTAAYAGQPRGGSTNRYEQNASGMDNREYSSRNFRNADLWFASIEEPYGLVGIGDEMVGLDVNPQAYKGAHFATFPEKLVRPCILASTSECGCCPTCGAGWVRITQSSRAPMRPGTDSKVNRASQHPDSRYNGQNGSVVGNRDPLRHCTSTVTTGWRPACSCPAAAPVPAVVFDPFAGSGTVGVVAVRLGRSFVGTELSAEYIELARERIEKAYADQGLFRQVKGVHP